ncbi:MAG: response regulator [Clostridiales Family XIII bacterium]|jgi:signal transduction histidine kinase/methyl-accepting chemotaxis protein/ActR/RegA family two-component response regulator|nr:response regulator [Clostridiales Family XIII bacterium]
MVVSLRKFGNFLSDKLDRLMDRFGVSMRTKLIVIFLLVKIVPLIILLLIAWSQFAQLGEDIKNRTQALSDSMNQTITETGELAVTDSREALNASAIEQIERITTDTAMEVANFLYSRDNDIRYLATLTPDEQGYRNFIENKSGQIVRQGTWDLAADGMSWERTDAPEAGTPENVSTNEENNDEVDGASFHYRPSDTFDLTTIPYYDEISFIGLDLKEQIKVTASASTKKTHPMNPALIDVTDKSQTYAGAETYGSEIADLAPGEIYVSDVIGEYVPSHFIGMYTPKQMVISALNAEITALNALAEDEQTSASKSLADALQKVKDEGLPALAVSGSTQDEASCARLMKDTAEAACALIDDCLEQSEAGQDEELAARMDALKAKIAGLTFNPAAEAFAGKENPNGVRFEGIVRWVTPVTDAAGNKIGYVSFALNHDHIMEFTDHITPMSDRYSELSSAFDGNYAFIWDYQCRSICHPRHHSIVGYNASTGDEQIPWLENSIYEELLSRVGGTELSDLEENWSDLVNDPQVPDADYAGVDDLLPDVPVFYKQSRSNKPAAALTAAGYVGLDGRYLNTAPQCTGWMDLTKDGGSGSFYILWSGLYKLTTAAAIPYYTGQYAPSEENGYSQRGFAMVTIGAGLDDFQQPAEETAAKLDESITQANTNITEASKEAQAAITDNLSATTVQLVTTTAIIVVLVIFIAIWMASFIANNVYLLIRGVTRFRLGDRRFRFHTERQDEFGELANSFDDMADSITESVHTPLVITDMDLNLIYLNDLALSAMGKKLEDVVGEPYFKNSIYPYGTEFCPVTAIDSGEEPQVYFNAKDGRHYRGDAKYLYDKEGEKVGYIITSTDVTEIAQSRQQLEKAVESANRANVAKGEFLARMSHEIRTPMNAIIGVTNIVEKKLGEVSGSAPEFEEIREHVTQIENSSQHLLGLLNDILDLSKIEAGKIEISEEPVNLLRLGATVRDIIEPRCLDKHITLEAEFDPSLDAPVLSDSLRLRQVLINLLGNAVKFTPEAGHIHFIIERADDSGAGAGDADGEEAVRVIFTVQDTGIGIDKAALTTIFEAFEQGDGSITRRFGGTGLGLPISQNIVHMLGGDIQVDSKVGEGSTFSFELVMKKSPHLKEPLQLPSDADVDFTGKTILIVDDVDINRMIASSLLEETGIAILEAENGEEAIHAFAESAPGSIDVVLMDVMMPVMNGLEAAAAIRALPREDAGSVPIIAITANAFKEDVEKALASGMNAHLAKPIDPEALIEMLYRYLFAG